MKLARVYQGKSACDRTFKVSAREGPVAVEAIRTRRFGKFVKPTSGGAFFPGRGTGTEAQREFEAVLRLKPDLPWALLNVGVALFKQGRRAEAVRQFEEALRLDPQLLPAKQYLEQLKSQPSSNP